MSSALASRYVGRLRALVEGCASLPCGTSPAASSAEAVLWELLGRIEAQALELAEAEVATLFMVDQARRGLWWLDRGSNAKATPQLRSTTQRQEMTEKVQSVSWDQHPSSQHADDEGPDAEAALRAAQQGVEGQQDEDPPRVHVLLCSEGGAILAVLQVLRSVAQAPFNTEDQELLRLFLRSCRSPLLNHVLRCDIEMVWQSSRNSRPSTAQDLASKMFSIGRLVTRARHAALYLVNSKTLEVYTETKEGGIAFSGHSVDSLGGIVGKVLGSGQLFISDSPRSLEIFDPSIDNLGVTEHGELQDCACIALRGQQERVLGCLMLGNRDMGNLHPGAERGFRGLDPLLLQAIVQSADGVVEACGGDQRQL